MSYDVVVIGAGVFGVWIAYKFRLSGAAVLLVDSYGPGNSRASSGGESRVSDFLLFEAAYAELAFLPVMWPDFDEAHLSEAVRHYQGIERRFGLTGEQVAGPGA